jgi:hypothetical protein
MHPPKSWKCGEGSWVLHCDSGVVASRPDERAIQVTHVYTYGILRKYYDTIFLFYTHTSHCVSVLKCHVNANTCIHPTILPSIIQLPLKQNLL